MAVVAGATREERASVLGLAAMSGFPIGSIIDLCLNGGHNLLPIEFAFYAVYGFLGIVAAAVGRAAFRR